MSVAFSTYAKTLSLAFPTYARTLSLEFPTCAGTLSLAIPTCARTLSLELLTCAGTLSLAIPTHARTLSLEFPTYAGTLSLALSTRIFNVCGDIKPRISDAREDIEPRTFQPMRSHRGRHRGVSRGPRSTADDWELEIVSCESWNAGRDTRVENANSVPSPGRWILW